MISFAVRRTTMYAGCANAIRIGARPNHPPERKAVISLLPARPGRLAEFRGTMKKITAILWATVALLPGTALAQEPPAQEPEGQLEEVIVTAERRAREHPGRAEFDIDHQRREARRAGLRRRGRACPGRARAEPEHRIVVRPRLPALLHPRLRQHRLRPQRVAAGLAVYDDVVQENPILKGFPVFDLDRVEVLRGPQGTLFGRNTPAGVVKFESVQARSAEFGGYGSVSYGTFDTVERRGRGRRPLRRGLVGAASRRSTSTATTGSTTPSPARTTSSRATTTAPRACSCCTSRRRLRARCSTCTCATSTAPRACSAPTSSSRGTNDLVDGFDADKISIDGQNLQDLDNHRRQRRACAGTSARSTLYSITGYETRRHAQPRRHRRRLRRGFCACRRARASSRSRARRRTACPTSTSSPRNSASSRTTPVPSTGRRACTTSTKTTTRQLQLRHAGRRRRRTATRSEPEQRRLGGVRLGQLRRDARRSSCAPACATPTTRRTSSPSAAGRASRFRVRRSPPTDRAI